MPTASITTQDTIDTLLNAWQTEEQEAAQRFEEQRNNLPLSERVKAGVALSGLTLVDMEGASGGALRIKLSPQQGPIDTHLFSLRSGAPVTLWINSPSDPKTTIDATLAYFKKHSVTLYVDQDTLPFWLEKGPVHLDQAMRDVTFERGRKALHTLKAATRDHAQLRERIYGDAGKPQKTPRNDTQQHTEHIDFFDTNLHKDQKLAIAQTFPERGELPELSLIHGPPGTGKTRTLIELIQQATQRNETVLACAASNLATDNLVERLLEHTSLKVVRIGHPARVTESATKATLDYLLEQHTLSSLARDWMKQAHAIRKRTWIKADRGNLSREERRQNLDEAKQLMFDARKQLRLAEKAILSQAQVICVTATGAEHPALNQIDFQRVILDEATQASDPVAWIALLRAPHIVLAGDPEQLPPTVQSKDAKVLSYTLFERLTANQQGQRTMLTQQHRMNTTLMQFPSEQSYQGELTAHPDVAHIELADLGVKDDPLRPGSLILIDTAGKGWEEEQDKSQSTFNPEQAQRTCAEARRLLQRGLPPHDLGIITPYSAQRSLLKELLEPEVEAGLEVASIDGFQGREKQAIILDLVRSNLQGELGFLQDLRRINVAITRAKRTLMIIADTATLGSHPYYTALLDYAQTHGSWISAWSDEAPPFDA